MSRCEPGIGGGGAQLCFPVQAGNYNTEPLIEVLDELRCFLGLGEAITATWQGIERVRRAWWLPYSFLRRAGLSVA